MSKAENKTKRTAVSVAAFLDAVPNETRRLDGKAVAKMMAEITGEKAAMWGPSIIGYGSYHYKYESGREGVMCAIGFSPRSTSLVLYLSDEYAGHAALMGKLGKHKTGVACLYINKLADVDAGVLKQMIAKSWAHMQAKYPPK